MSLAGDKNKPAVCKLAMGKCQTSCWICSAQAKKEDEGSPQVPTFTSLILSAPGLFQSAALKAQSVLPETTLEALGQTF